MVSLCSADCHTNTGILTTFHDGLETTENNTLIMESVLSRLSKTRSTIPPSMTGGNSTPSVMHKREKFPFVNWGPYTKLRDGVGFKWYTHMRDCTSVESAKGNHECLVTMHAQIDESEPSICWFLRFQLLEKAPGDAEACTRPNEQTSQLCLRVKANDEEFGWVNVELNYRPEVPRLDTTVHCDGIPNLWHISRKAAGKWLDGRQGYQGIARSLLQLDLANDQAEHFTHEVYSLIKGICAKGERLQKDKAKFTLRQPKEESLD